MWYNVVLWGTDGNMIRLKLSSFHDAIQYDVPSEGGSGETNNDEGGATAAKKPKRQRPERGQNARIHFEGQLVRYRDGGDRGTA
ncbi:hypothetical protein ACHAXR_011024 [Thalassiosira sp. AJA248-18]